MSENDPSIGGLLDQSESAHLEQKAAGTSLAAIGRTVCAFLNSGGGQILVAAGSSQEARAKAMEVEQQLRMTVKPAAFWTTGTAEFRGAHFCILHVPVGRDRPYAADGKIYLRVGTADVLAPPADIQGLVERTFQETERWERRPLPGAGLERLDLSLIKDTAKTGIQKRHFPLEDAEHPEAVLTSLALYRRGVITNAAEVLFGIRPAIQFPQVRAQISVYALRKASDLVDSQTFEGPVTRMLEEMLRMIRKHTPVSSLFRGGLRRTDQPAYPEEAVREGLVNAFAHRDYADFRGGISVHLYPERLVIWNAGQLPPGIRIVDLKREHPSMPQNPDISQVLWLRGYMERVGRGTQSILEWCREAGLPDPAWQTGAGVTLTFRFPTKGINLRFNARQKKLLADLQPGDRIRQPEYCREYLVSERQGRRDLTGLVEGGFLAREGEGARTIFVRLDKAERVPGHTRP